jgi:asparagine synthase (glutamine-hydrolysing)
MCGVTGIISRGSISYSTIKAMNDKLFHRGPDDEGFLLSGNCVADCSLSKKSYIEGNITLAFGHRRLAIVDLSPLGHQPMHYINRYWIVYNGEVYNHFELRNELIDRGYSFASNTDTEVIMAAYDFWGKDCLGKFNGMWAFVLYDLHRNEFFISRDRFGVKPLYYYQDEDNFIFSSEIKAILANPIVTPMENRAFIRDYINDGCKEYTTDTAFEGIRRFDFGSSVILSGDSVFSPFKELKFWTVSPNLSDELFNIETAHRYAEHYYELLYDAVKLRLRADVKVGSASSGGLDSSSIVYLINQQLKDQGREEQQTTFSTVYNTPGTESCDESIFIDEITRDLKVNSQRIEPLEADVPREHERVIYHLENPPEGTLMSSWYTFKLVGSSDVVVTLDGQGADEQLAGYLPYIINYWATKRNLTGGLKELYHFWRTNTLKYAVIGLSFNLARKIFTENWVIGFASKMTGKQVKIYENLNQRLYDDTFSSLITLIHYADHTSMAHTVESRMPFMDYRLVEFLMSIPACYKIHEGWTKYIARLAFDAKLPDNIVWRKDKMGWPIPEELWINGGLSRWFEEGVSDGFARTGDIPPKDLGIVERSRALRYLNLSVYYKIFIK